VMSLPGEIREARERLRAQRIAKKSRRYGTWIERLFCWLRGGHHAGTSFEGQSVRVFKDDEGGELWYYGRCPRCGMYVVGDYVTDKWFDFRSPPTFDGEGYRFPPPPPRPNIEVGTHVKD